MFETNNDDDIDIDDEFLSGVFESNQKNISSATPPRIEEKFVFNPQYQKTCLNTVDGSPARANILNQSDAFGHFLNHNVFNNQDSAVNSSVENKSLVHHESKEIKRKNLSSPTPSRPKRERKFPGPAGLLPDRAATKTPMKLDYILEAGKSPSTATDELCSQGRCSGSILEEEPWQNFLSDLGSDKHILDTVNVASVKRKAAAKCFVGRKVPFLAAVLHHLDVSSPDPCIILRDSTGEIHGTLHRAVWEQFAGELLVGSVLVIRNVGVLSTGVSSRRHYLNITTKNIATIYSANQDKSQKVSLHPFTSQDFIQTIEQWRSLVSPSHGVGSPAASVGSPALFSPSVASSPLQSQGHLFTNSIPRRTEVNKRLQTMVQESHITARTKQSAHYGISTTPTPNHSARPPFVSGAASKSLLPSFTSRSNQSSHYSNSFNNDRILNNNSSFNNLTSAKSNITREYSLPGGSNLIQRSTSSKTDFFHCDQTPSCSNTDILKPNNCNNVYPQSTIQRYPGNILSGSMCETICESSQNSSKLILSQSSQLTAEEQSVVESVFDGIDADSLFDDDF